MEEKSFSLYNASIDELIKMPEEEIFAEVVKHYDDLYEQCEKGVISDNIKEDFYRRSGRSAILFANGKNLYLRHPELGRKLMIASIFWGDSRGISCLDSEKRSNKRSILRGKKGYYRSMSYLRGKWHRTPDQSFVSFLKTNAVKEVFFNKATKQMDYYYKIDTLLYDKNGNSIGYKKIVDWGITKEM